MLIRLRQFALFLCFAGILGGCAGAIAMSEPDLLYNFDDPDTLSDWIAVNDGVMGGVSSGSIRATDRGTALFSGVLSFKNNGGFASIRSRPRSWNLSGRSGLALRVLGDGRTYKLNLRTDADFDGINYRVEFTTAPGEWQTWQMPFEEFRATFRGRDVRNAAPLNPAQITSVGFLIADKREDPFSLEIGWIGAYSAGE